MDISVAIPNGLVDVSNGKFVGKTDLGDGYTRWDWHVSYPINNYDVSLNIGNYVHWSDKLGELPLDYYVLPEDLEKAKKQFAQVKGMLEAYQHYFGPYPFVRDGYKLIEVPYAGHGASERGGLRQSFSRTATWAATGPAWASACASTSSSFTRAAHEWFGNSITAADPSDMWIHEGWTTYLESLYVEYRWGKDDAIKYLNGLKPKVIQPAAHRCRARRECRAHRGPVLQGRADAQHAAQRHQRRRQVVCAASTASISTSSIRTS